MKITRKRGGKKPAGAAFDREMELTEHLAELRTRIIRSLLYVAVGLAVAWFQYDRILDLLKSPIVSIKGKVVWQQIFTSFMEPFFLRLQVSAVSGIILMFPLLLKEAWGFVAPALTRNERRAVYFVLPLCVLLFAAGIATAFFVAPAGIRWFLGFLPSDTALMQKLNDYVVFLVKMCLAFGLMFQLPVVMLFLGKVGLVNSRFLARYWRQAIVLAAAAAAIITPSADAFTMVAAMAPLTVLYGLSIILVKFVEHPDKPSILERHLSWDNEPRAVPVPPAPVAIRADDDAGHPDAGGEASAWEDPDGDAGKGGGKPDAVPADAGASAEPPAPAASPDDADDEAPGRPAGLDARKD